MLLADKIAQIALAVSIISGIGTWYADQRFRRWCDRHWKDLLIFILVIALIFKLRECWPKHNPVPVPTPPPPPAWIIQDSVSCARGNDSRGEMFLTDPDPTAQRNIGIQPCGHTVKSGSNSSVPLYAVTEGVNTGKITTHSDNYMGGRVKPIGFTLKFDPTPPSGQQLWELTGGIPDNCKKHVGMVSFSSGQLACVNDSIGFIARP